MHRSGKEGAELIPDPPVTGPRATRNIKREEPPRNIKREEPPWNIKREEPPRNIKCEEPPGT